MAATVRERRDHMVAEGLLQKINAKLSLLPSGKLVQCATYVVKKADFDEMQEVQQRSVMGHKSGRLNMLALWKIGFCKVN